MTTNNELHLEILCQDDAYLVDSRVLAKRLGYDHETVARAIKRHTPRLEKKSSLRQIVGVKPRASRGATREVYYLLDERQCLILTGSLKRGEEAEEWHDRLVDAFLQARHRLAQVEAHPAAPSPPQIHALTDAMRARALANLARVPEGHFSVMAELFKGLYNLEGVLNQALDDKAMPEISVGLRWSAYAREVLHLPDTDRCSYEHRCPNGRIVHAWAYPIWLLTAFDQWLWRDYFPLAFPDYQRYRAGVVQAGSQQQRLGDGAARKRLR